MSNKKIKVIILGVVALILIVFTIFLFKDKNIENNENKNVKLENSENKIIEDENIDDILKELKNNHPEFSDSQLEFYREAAKNDKEILVPCEGREDENDCIASVAFIKGASGICDEIEKWEAKIECANAVLKKLSAEKINECWSLDDGHGFVINCLRNIFAIYDKAEDCSILISSEVRQACEDIFYYETVFLWQNLELCERITDEKLNQYCFKNVIDKFLDSDNDGLTDINEEKFGTDPNNHDTNGDGYSDGEEIRKGYNPLSKD